MQLEQREEELEKTGSWSTSGHDVHVIEQAPLVRHEFSQPFSDFDKVKSEISGLMSGFAEGFANTMRTMG